MLLLDDAAEAPGRVMTAILAAAEAAELTACEQVIERGLKTFAEVGQALARIRDGRLYRATHPTFEDYCRERWSLSARHANRTIEAARVTESLGPIGPAPANEAQARELAPLLNEPDQLRETWQRAVEAVAGKPTAADVAAARGQPGPQDDDDGDAFQEQCAEARRTAAEWGTPASDEFCHIYAEVVLIANAARNLLRHGILDLPPQSWTWSRLPEHARGRTPISAARSRLVRERNRLAIWQILVEREAGSFLIFCDKAGIGTNGKITFPDGLLRYPLEEGDPPLPEEWTAEDEHQAALGRFYAWWYTRDELAEMCGGAA